MTGATVAPVAQARTPFVLLTMQRTGSGWVMDRINNVPGAQGHMELFYHLPRQTPPMASCNDYPRFVEMRARLPKRRTAAVFEYLDGLYQRPGSVGFKLMYSQLRQNPQILPYLVRRRVRIVHLVRENLLDILLSEELARVTGTSHISRDQALLQVQVALDPGTLVARVRRLAASASSCRDCWHCCPMRSSRSRTRRFARIRRSSGGCVILFGFRPPTRTLPRPGW
jgi:LPS sulfotransferase NodH